MGRKYSSQEIVIRIKNLHGDLITLDESTYVNTRTRCCFIDKDYGIWWTDPWSVLCGRKHPNRGKEEMIKKQTVSLKEVKKRLLKVHGNKIKIGDDYNGVCKKCTFIDHELGEWIALPQHILSGVGHPKRKGERAKITCLKRYGVAHTMHIPEIVRKVSSKHPRWTKQFHWKTGEELTCMSSYEVAFMNWCSQNKIDFEWQIKHTMPDGRAYFVDAYIIDGEFANTWIEIKGWMTKIGQEKWDWFHQKNSNSELWTLEKLKNLAIL